MLLILPPELLSRILLQVSDRDIFNLGYVSKTTKYAIDHNDIFWRAKAQRQLLLDIDVDYFSRYILFKYRFIDLMILIEIFTDAMENKECPSKDIIESLVQLFEQCDLTALLMDKSNKLLTSWYKFIIEFVILESSVFPSKTITIIPIPYSVLSQHFPEKSSHDNSVIFNLFKCNRVYYVPHFKPINIKDAMTFIDQVICETTDQHINLIMVLIEYCVIHCPNEKGTINTIIKGCLFRYSPIIDFCIKRLSNPMFHDESIIDYFKRNSLSLPTVTMLIYILHKAHNSIVICNILKLYLNTLELLHHNGISVLLDNIKFEIDINVLASYNSKNRYVYINDFKTSVINYVSKFPNSMTPENLEKILNI